MEIGRIKDTKPKNSAEKSLPNAPAPYRDSLKEEVEKWKARVQKLLVPDTPPIDIEDRNGQSKEIITSELTDECWKDAKRNSDADVLPKRPKKESEADDVNSAEKFRRKTDEFPTSNEVVNCPQTDTISTDLPLTSKSTKSSDDLQRIEPTDMPPIDPSYDDTSTFDVQGDATYGNVRENIRLNTRLKTPLDAYFSERMNELVERIRRNLCKVFEKWINDSNGWNKYISIVLFQSKTPMNDAYEGNHDQSLDYYGKSPWFSSQKLEL